MKKKVAVVSAICLIAAFVSTSLIYVHRGYIGVIGSGESLRLLGHGPHLKVPGDRVTFYPVRYQQVHLRVSEDGLDGKVELDMLLHISVNPDSIPSLHRAYQGAYIERLVSPAIVEFLRQRGDASEAWSDGIGSEVEGKKITQHLSPMAASHGINVYRALVRSYEVTGGPGNGPGTLSR